MNTPATILFGCSLLVAASIGPAGCDLAKPYPAKQLYAINVGAPPAAAAPAPAPTLRVQRVRVASPYSSREFHYLIGPNQFQTDYYANFVTDPDQLLTGQLIEWMSSTGMYAAVVDASSSVGSDRSLQCVVSELYGDMSNAAAPTAVIAARFFLLDDSDVDSKVLFTRDYRQAEPVGASNPDDLTSAWGRAMNKILAQLTTDLRAMP